MLIYDCKVMRHLDHPGSRTELSTEKLLLVPHVPKRYTSGDLLHNPVAADVIRKHRNMLVKFNHWLDLGDEDDKDRYDEDPASNKTSFLVVCGDKNIHQRLVDRPITAAVRMTGVDHITESLSVEMWSHARDGITIETLEGKISSELGENDPSALDLTRFLTLSTIDHYPDDMKADVAIASIKGMLELFGGGIAFLEKDEVIDRKTGRDKIILFTTAYPIMRLMQELGLDIRVLHQGQIGENDKTESALCAVPVITGVLESTLPQNKDEFYRQFSSTLQDAYTAVLGSDK